MKRPLIITLALVLALLLCTVCSTAAVSATQGRSVIYVYTTPDKTAAHPSPDGNLKPFTEYVTDATPEAAARATGATLTTSVTPISASDELSASAGLASSFYVQDYEALKDKPITLTVKVSYTMSGSGDAFRNRIVVTVPENMGQFGVKTVAFQPSNDPGTVSQTTSVTITTDRVGAPLTLATLCGESAGVGEVQVTALSFASLGSTASMTADVSQMRIDFVE